MILFGGCLEDAHNGLLKELQRGERLFAYRVFVQELSLGRAGLTRVQGFVILSPAKAGDHIRRSSMPELDVVIC